MTLIIDKWKFLPMAAEERSEGTELDFIHR